MRCGSLARLACWLALFAACPAIGQTVPTGAAVPAAATLDSTELPTAGEHATLLRVTRPGRFAIRTTSPTGTALQLVDMLTGPSGLAGAAGASDGRLDELLDVGTYKLRLFGAAKAQGATRLSVEAFHDLGPPEMLPVAAAIAASELADLQQRRYMLIVAAAGPVRIEAAGRSLRDLRLWRDGTDLVPVEAVAGTVEPIRGHALNDLVLNGNIEAGSYVVTAYGGPARVWPDGGTAQPLYLRVGGLPALSEGWVRGRIGPLGSEIYEVGPRETSFRLELADPAPAELKLSSAGRILAQAAIAKNSREPSATLAAAASTGGKRWVEVSGSAGQDFTLRGFWLTGAHSQSAPGDWWVAAESIGAGGDELPLTALLLRLDPKRGGIPVAGSAPQIGLARAWRYRFNLRGASSLLFEVTEAGPVAMRGDGPAVRAAIDALGGEHAPLGTPPAEWNLPAGWYVLRLDPVGGAAGPLDLTLGPPGLVPARPSDRQPAAPAIAFGLQQVKTGQSLSLVSGEGPGVRIDLAARRLPADLEQLPLTVTVTAGAPLRLPVRLPLGGNLVATVIGEGAAAVELRDRHVEVAGRVGTAYLAAAGHLRSVILSWHPPAPAAKPPPSAPAAPEAAPLTTGRSLFFDLARNEHKSFAFAVAQGGLYRIETEGRLETEGWIGTPFVAEIDHQAANGRGKNMMLQSYLRAGRYRVSVAARDSAGHAGLLANPAPMLQGGALLPGGSVRATMAAGSGLAFPIEIADPGNYHIDLVGLGRKFTARLEDAEGWPILPAGDLSSLDRTLSSGHYRLLVLPTGVDARVVAMLRRIAPAAVPQGHGPHPLVLDAEQHFEWREPVGRNDPRLPDRWDFALEGPAHLTIDISDGMVAALRRAEPADAPVLARLVYKSGFSGDLGAGRYRVEASSLGRNDRLDYTLALHSEELQPDRPRRIALPATVPFAIARDRVVSLTSFGDVAVKALLRDRDGRVLGRYDGRVDDWNIAVSRHLPAGHYRLDLSAAAPAASPAIGGQDAPGETAPPPQVELRLALPGEDATAAAPAAGALTLQGAEVHRLTLPPAPAGRLILAAAASSAELVLTLERRDRGGVWHEVALDQGRSPVVAVPADGDADRPWRLVLWTVDGGPEPVQLAVRSIDASPQSIGTIDLAAIALDRVSQHLRTALVAVPEAGLVRLADTGGILAGSSPGEGLRPVEGGVIVPQSERVWLLARGRAVPSLPLSALVPSTAEPVVLSLPEGATATLPAGPAGDGRLRFWLAESGFGQPGLAAGRGMGVATGSAFGLAGPIPLKVWNAGERNAFRLELRALDLRLLPERPSGAALSATLPARSAVPLRLASGGKRLRVDLPAGAAAIMGWRAADAVAAWTGSASASWLFEGGWEDVLLVNTAARPLPVMVSGAPLPGAPFVLRPGAAEKRFFGAAGILSLPFEAQPGQRLMVAGAWATVVGADGSVRGGTAIPLAGPGRLALRHQAGLVAAWIEGAGVSPWPAAVPRSVVLPAELSLTGETMNLSFGAGGPTLLHVRSSAPVIAVLVRGSHEEAPALFAAGAEFHRYLPAGNAELRLISPSDGPLTGSLEITTTPVVPVGEGVGEAVAVAPGGTALFAFEVVGDGAVGVGIRADPDRATARLLDANGAVLGNGIAMLRRLRPGHYLVEARLPPDAPTATVRPAVIGIGRHPAGPPAEVARHYLELVGMVPTTAR